MDGHQIDAIGDTPTALTYANQTDGIVGTNIQNLKDNCLLQIFSSHSLSPKDLCSLAETCHRFQQMTQQVCEEFSIEDGRKYVIKWNNHVEGIENGSDIVQIVKNLGAFLSTLSIRKNDPAVVNSIATYCSGGTLRKLEIRSVDVTESFAVTFKPIFQQLRTLRLMQAPIQCSANLFANCHRLAELEITSTTLKCNAILENTFPNLKRFAFSIGIPRQFDKFFERKYGREFERFTETFFKFIERHNHLKTLALNSRFVYRSGDFVHTIGNSCKTLEELTLQNFYDTKIAVDFSKLQSMTTLRMLDVDIGFPNYGGLTSLLQTLKSLESVKLLHVSINPIVHDDFLPFLSQLRGLRELHLINCATSYYFPIPWTMLIGLRKLHIIDFCGAFSIVEIIGQLTNLNETVIDVKNFVINEEMFSKIVKLKERRSRDVLTLKCRFKFSEMFSKNNCEKKQNVILVNLN